MTEEQLSQQLEELCTRRSAIWSQPYRSLDDSLEVVKLTNEIAFVTEERRFARAGDQVAARQQAAANSDLEGDRTKVPQGNLRPERKKDYRPGLHVGTVNTAVRARVDELPADDPRRALLAALLDT